MYYRLVIWRIDLITKLRPGDNCHGWSYRLPSPRWSPTIPRIRMVTHYPRDNHLSTLCWSPIIQNHIPKYCCPASQGWSPMIPSMVTHHPKLLKSDKTLQLQLNKEFDTSAAQLVIYIMIHVMM